MAEPSSGGSAPPGAPGSPPAEVGLPVGTGVRRTPGLRREEVAVLAGMSIDYYTRLERGKETRPSPAVVDSLARALTPGRRLGVFVAEPGTPDHDAMILLDMTAPRPAGHPTSPAL
ncbi:MAG TPA: helix-turn-helix transcriptional regulator [Actinospica sp.]|jgi:hypothetical protein|nr:helix-turn-helix transcriptional regulator [Actinospica sp.]HWG28783.1 helix-turn-helix transcriptional regulator [Actinospica sp.]